MKPRTVQAISTLLMITTLTGAAFMVPPINAQRKDLQLNTLSDEAVRTLPPNEALTTAALSIFRGLAVDVLWYRMNRLKEEGSYFEINQISNWIVTLQPRFSQVWSFMAWNMAYNISVATNTKEERWDWVNKGVRLIRERGIPYNPDAIRLYREAGWIFYHKIGQFTDDMNWYYKQRLALEWQEVIGQPSDGATTAQIIERFEKINTAPDTLELLRDSDPGMPGFLDAMSDIGAPPDEPTLRLIGRILMIRASLDAKALGVGVQQLRDDRAAKIQTLLADPQYATASVAYVAFLRKRVITDNYRMSTDHMLKIMKEYGPLDWRHPAAHSCYWFSLGTSKIAELRKQIDEGRAKKLVAGQDIDLLNTYRGTIQSLQELMYRGRISFDFVGQRPPDFLPEPRFIDAYDKAMMLAREELVKNGTFLEDTTQFDSGHENFLFTAICFAYFYGDRADAQRYLDRAHELYGKLPDRVMQPRYTLALDDVVFDETFRNLDLLYHARQFIDGMMSKAFSEGLLNNRADVYDRFIDMAKRVHKKFNENIRNVPNAPQDPGGLPPFDKMLADGYTSFMRLPQVDPLRRFNMWHNTPIELRRATYDRIKDVALPAAEQAGLDPERTFSEPEGMAEWRKENPANLDPAASDGSTEIERN